MLIEVPLHAGKVFGAISAGKFGEDCVNVVSQRGDACFLGESMG